MTRLSAFETLHEIGAGYQGRVWLARGEVSARRGQPPRPRVVAIKQLRAGANADAQRRLLQEFALLDQVKHRAIVRVFQYLPEDHAVVMEPVHGVTLRQVLDDCNARGEPMYSEAALEIGCELADALFQAWTTPGDDGEPLRLVHRDLKPENLMLTPTGEVKILDFGLARGRSPEVVAEPGNRARGTPIYMAPEQARGEEVDHRTDLFAVGLLLFEMLLRRPAWTVPPDATDPVQGTIEHVARGTLETECREVETKLGTPGAIVARLLQTRPRNRYQTGQDLLVALRRQLYREPGAWLREFCDYYFGTVHPLGPFPEPVTHEVEMAEKNDRGGPVRPVPRVIQRAGSAPEEDWGEPGSVRGSGAPRAGGSRPKVIGARSPDETGMLPLTPLSTNPDARAVAIDPTATQMIALPAPAASRPRGAPPPAFQPPMPGSAAPVAPVAAAAPGPIQGPVAGGGITGPTPASPFQPGGPMPASEPEADSRVQSWRVWAVVLAMFAFACIVFVSLLVVAYTQFAATKEAVTEPTVVTAPTPVAIEEREVVDDPVPAEPTVVTAPTTRRTTPKRPTTPSGAAAEPAPVKVDKGTATVTFRMDPVPTSVRVSCPDGTTRNVAVSGASVKIPDVDADKGCQIRPYGPGVVSTTTTVKGGRSYACDVENSNLLCR